MLPSSTTPKVGIVALASAFVVAVCLSLVAMDGWRTYHARQIQLAEGETAALNLVRAIAQHAVGTLKEVDAVTVGLVDRVESEGTGASSIERLHPLLSRYASTIPQLERLSIIGRDGRWLTSSQRIVGTPVDVSDRDYFKYHASDSSRDAYIGSLDRRASTDEWILTISRRFNDARGNFAGVVVAAIDLQYFGSFYGELNVGNEGTLVLAARRGQLLQRKPFRADLIGTDLRGSDLFRNHVSKVSEGLVTQISSIDHIERQIAFKSLDEYPLYVVAALSTSDTLSSWKADAITHMAFVGLLVTALAFSGFWLVAQIRQRSVVERELSNSRVALEGVNRQLSTMVREDALTRLVNRRELDRVLAEEISRAERTRAPLALIMLDIDYFKLFNDSYGHPAGDECLRQVARVLAACIRRPGDVAARYGGEEFAILLPGADVVGAGAVAQAVCEAVRGLEFRHPASPKGIVTISAGIAMLTPDGNHASPDGLLRMADMALYAAKNAGRDTVSVAGPPAPVGRVDHEVLEPG